MKDFNQPQQDFVNSMGRAFRSARDIDEGTFVFIGLLSFILFIITIYVLNKRWHWIRGKWIFIQKYLAGRAKYNLRKTKHFEVVLEPPYGADRMVHTTTGDLSPTGMFIRMNPPMKKGEIFRFILNLPPENRVQGLAEVKWAQNRWTEHHPSGNGCRFTKLAAEDQLKIKTALRQKL